MTGRYPELGAIHLLTPYGHTNIYNVFKMFYLRNQVLVKRAAKQTNSIFNNLQCCPSKYSST